MTLHREDAWQEQGTMPEHLTQRFESRMVAASRRMTAHGSGGISEFWQTAKLSFRI
jgi:hypothetical protein